MSRGRPRGFVGILCGDHLARGGLAISARLIFFPSEVDGEDLWRAGGVIYRGGKLADSQNGGLYRGQEGGFLRPGAQDCRIMYCAADHPVSQESLEGVRKGQPVAGVRPLAATEKAGGGGR